MNPLLHAAAYNDMWAVGLKGGHVFITLFFKVSFIFKNEVLLIKTPFELTSLDKNMLIVFLWQLQSNDFHILTS